MQFRHFFLFSFIWLWLISTSLQAELVRLYVASLDSHSCTLAWGDTNGGSKNTIGRDATGVGKVSLEFGNQAHPTTSAWFRVDNLNPDSVYPYRLTRDGMTLASGSIRTWPDAASDLTFFVIGDWGNASRLQYKIAERMEQERQRLSNSGSPVRFVLSTGDNIYGGGNRDRDWDSHFFKPYASTLAAIPFYAVLGNHDGNESESSADLPVYLDNFFAPSGPMRRWYHFRYANFAEFFALDSTTNQFPGNPAPAYLPDGDQSRWLSTEVKQVSAPWRLAFFHHPMFTAGPRHEPSLPRLQHWLNLFREYGFSAAFSGHEHNLQVSENSTNTGNMIHVVSGAGGELRKGNVKSRMRERHMAAWAAQAHFLIVHLTRDTMTIMPVTDGQLRLQDAKGDPVPVPISVPRRTP